MPEARKLREWLVAAGVFLLPLIWWPGAERPFSTPKLWLLGALCACVAAVRPRVSIEWPWLVWLGAVALSAATGSFVSAPALLLTLAAIPLFLAARCAGNLAIAITCASVAESVIVLLQFAGLDPLQFGGWRPELFASSRMRVYGTLGNPNFVAAWLCATLPLHLTLRASPWVRAAAFALQLGAIAATGSRVFVLALPFFVLRRNRWWIGAAAAAALVLLWLSPARPLRETLEGRLHLGHVTAAHLLEIPPFGHGPGSFETQFAQWQVDWFRLEGSGTPAARFAGPVDHAHNDFLEFWVEYGPVGLAAFLGLCGWLIAKAWRFRYGPALSGAAGLLAIACVDFPFHRPAEWALFWMLLGIAHKENLKCPIR